MARSPGWSGVTKMRTSIATVSQCYARDVGRFRDSFGFGNFDEFRQQLRDIFRNADPHVLAAILGAATVCLAVWGGWKVFVAIRNDTQMEMSCAEYIEKKPETRWLKLWDCAYDYEHYAFVKSTRGGRITAVYLPLKPWRGSDNGEKAQIVAKRTDDDMLAVIDALEDGREPPHDALQRLDKEATEAIEGLVRYGLETDTHERELRSLKMDLARNYVVLERGEKPRLILGIAAIIGSLACAAGAIAFLVAARKRKLNQSTVSERAPPTTTADHQSTGES